MPSGNLIPAFNPSVVSYWRYSSYSTSGTVGMYVTSSGSQSAEEFTVPNDYDYELYSITLGLAFPTFTLSGTNNDLNNFELNLLGDNNGIPGSVIQILNTGTTNISTPPARIGSSFIAPTFIVPNGITLLAGKSYWIEATPTTINVTSAENNLSVDWFYSEQPLANSVFSFNNYSSSGVLQGWQTQSYNGGPALSIEATAVPEPLSCATLILGLMILVFIEFVRTKSRI